MIASKYFHLRLTEITRIQLLPLSLNLFVAANNNEPVPVLLPGQNISPYEGEVVFVTGPNGFKHYGEIESTYPGIHVYLIGHLHFRPKLLLKLC